MGHNRRWRTLTDATKYDADIVIACRHKPCGFTLVIDYETLRAIIGEFRVNPELTVLARALRCSRCGHRWPVVEMTAKGDSRTLALKDGDPLPPRGIPISVWLTAHNSERKRLRRLNRG